MPSRSTRCRGPLAFSSSPPYCSHAVHFHGAVYVAAANAILQFHLDVLDHSSLPAGEIGHGVLQRAEMMAFIGTEVFVSDSASSVVFVFRLADGELVRSIGMAGEEAESESLQSPTGIAIARGELFVADGARDCVQVYSLRGESRRCLPIRPTDGNTTAPCGVRGLAVHAGEVFVTDGHCVRVLSAEDGTPLRHWGSQGSGAGQLVAPCGLACSGGRIHVSDQGPPCRVLTFTLLGELVCEVCAPEGSLELGLISAHETGNCPLPGATPSPQACDGETELLVVGKRHVAAAPLEPETAANAPGVVGTSSEEGAVFVFLQE